MANQSVLELAVGTGKWDSGLKKAQQSLNNFVNASGGLDKALQSENEKISQFVKMMGDMTSKAGTAKGQMNDYKRVLEQLTAQYNSMSEAQKSTIGQDFLQSIDKIKVKFQDAKSQVEEFNRSLGEIKAPEIGKESGGGLFGGKGLTDMLAVAGGNLLSKGITALTSELTESVQQSIDLARAGEGVRLAFERLNQPGILDRLKEATHGTVSEVELMKQAIKFENFKLPLEDLATYLAFAQQKAKDTGESVDYMVNSITTGLGRQSKQILDNLGISAAELTRRMNEGADMTKAVADIIREEMAKAGDYVETSADRAARAAADASNKMEEIGRQAMPVAEEWSKAWNSIKLGGMEVLTTVLGPIAESINDIQRILSGEFELKIKANIPNLAEGGQSPWANWKPGTDHTVQAPGGYVEVTDSNTGAVIGGGHFDNLNDTNSIKAWQKSLVKTTSTKSGSKTVKTEEQLNNEEIQKLTQEYLKASEQRQEAIRAEIKTLQERNAQIQQLKDEATGKAAPLGKIQAATGSLILNNDNPFEKYKDAAIELVTPLQALENELKSLQEAQAKAWSPEVFAAYQQKIEEVKGKIGVFKDVKKDADDSAKSFRKAASAVQTVGSAMQSIEDPSAKIMGIIAQAVANIALAFSKADVKDGETGNVWYWIAATAAGVATMVSTISSIKSATSGYANGGIVKGNSYSGDNIGGLVDGSQFVGLNAGEVVLNASQQQNLASNLQGSGGGKMEIVGVLTGENVVLMADRWGRRTGRGELLFAKNL